MHKYSKFNFALYSPAFVLIIITAILITVSEAGAVPVTVDMSDHGGGIFYQEYFRPKGVVFTDGDFVGYVQGDDALVFDQSNGITGLFAPAAVTSISVDIAPWLQGTWAYRLAALNVLSNIIDSKTILVTQDTGDPENTGFGYFSIELTGLPGAAGFLVDSTFIRTSYGTTSANNIAALSSISFSKIPEPATFALFGIGMAALGLIRRQRIKS